MQVQNNIGKVIKFDESKHDRLLRAWETILPMINEIISEYNDLGIGSLTKPSLVELITTDKAFEKAKSAYRTLVQKDVTGFKTKLLKDAFLAKVDDYVQPLKERVSTLQSALVELKTGNDLNFDDLEIEKNYIFLNQDAVRQRCELKISSEDQAIVFELAENVIKAYTELRTVLISKNPNWERWVLINNVGTGIIKLENDLTISIVPEAVVRTV